MLFMPTIKWFLFLVSDFCTMINPLEKIEKWEIILASQSPRRQELLRGLGINFSIKILEADESYPSHLSGSEIALYVAKKKAEAFGNQLTEKQLVITSDTIVWANNQMLGKPVDKDNARKMLQTLSGIPHYVYTGVCLKSINKISSFVAETVVYYKTLSKEEIEFYLEHYKPYDKAGAYGIQEWIGYIGIERIDGSYFNVMGLPVQRLYNELLNF